MFAQLEKKVYILDNSVSISIKVAAKSRYSDTLRAPTLNHSLERENEPFSKFHGAVKSEKTIFIVN
jgi:hypothetical protein